jgi:hypothetical protein
MYLIDTISKNKNEGSNVLEDERLILELSQARKLAFRSRNRAV